MAQTLADKLRQVLEPVTIPRGGHTYSVGDYFRLPPDGRADDEADVVDGRLAPVFLGLLGYAPQDWEYNRNNAGGRPDFLIAPEGRLAFFLEDKRTSTPLALPQLEQQLQRYAESLTPVGLAFNGREVLAVRLTAGRLSPTLRVDLLAAAGILPPDQLTLEPEAHQAALSVLVELFQRPRFTGVRERLRRLACPEAMWREQARDINASIDPFGEHAARLVVRLSRVAYATLSEHLQETQAFSQEMARVENRALDLVRNTPVPPVIRERFVAAGEALASLLGRASEGRITSLAGMLDQQGRVRRFADQLRALNGEAKTLELYYEESLEVGRRYERWRDLERRFEASLGETGEQAETTRRWRFARQCAYVLFLRIFLVRILEDKGLLQRLISDGGLDLWKETVKPRFAPNLGDLSSAPLIDLAFGQAAAISGDLHRRDVYDWFMPDDTSIVDILEVLHQYDFGRLATDVIGYTYQRFLEETERHRLGHYLTPPAVIDHILDSAGYLPGNPEILGRDVLDPACGSGSFLVHAAVRYRAALARAYEGQEEEAARRFLQAIHERFIGIDINPFSCYLARINLLVQALDDIARLRSAGATIVLGELLVHNADSLDFQGIPAGQGALPGTLPTVSDPVLRLKAERAGNVAYVFANPPYINVKQENLYLADIQGLPFFADWLHGDANTYLLFLRVGLHFLAPNGVLAFIVPSTVLGDQQAERFRRRALSEGFRLAHVTRFYAERVLFKPVEQATSVLVVRRTDAEGPVRIKGGGMGASSAEAIGDVARRPVFDLPGDRLRVWVSPTAVPQAGPLAAPAGAQWIQLWPIMPERQEYYALWEALCRGSNLTVGQLFDRLRLPMARIVSQGDVNTTHAIPFHVPGNAPGATPLYKGEEIDQLIPLDYLPTRGPKGRTPFLAPHEDKLQTAPQRAALAALKRLATLEAVERGFVLHEVAKFRVPRRIAGTYFERGPGRRTPVFPHTLWVAADLSENAAKGLLGLLTSLPVNFAFHFCSTNNHVVRTLLACLPVPDRAIAELPALGALTAQALDAGRALVVLFDQVSVERGRALRTGVPVVDPVTLLNRKGLPKVRVIAWRERGWLRLPAEAGLVERLTVGKLAERHALTANGPAGAGEVLGLWLSAYGDRKWREFETLDIADAPAGYLKTWQATQDALRDVAARREVAQQAIDDAVANLYAIPDALREVLRVGPPWLAGRPRAGEAEPEEEEEG